MQPRTRRLLWGGFFAATAVLLAIAARDVEWHELVRALRRQHPETVLLAAALAAFGHLVYTSFDVLARSYTRHRLPVRLVMAIGFVSYAFNLSLGPLIGAAGFRYRLYSQFGLSSGAIGRVLGFSIVTNWLGYGALAGALFASKGVPVPSSGRLAPAALQGIGIAMLLALAGYLLLCATAKRRQRRVRGTVIELPPLRIALVQPLVAALSWATIALLLWLLLGGQVAYATVLGATLLAAVGAALTHIPGGLGVLETVFVVTLGGALPRSQVLASLLAYRALYYLVPLLVAGVVYAVLESRARSSAPRRCAPAGGGGSSGFPGG
jgi:uncharacterized membrane protein YbhN (UPF0104 family)